MLADDFQNRDRRRSGPGARVPRLSLLPGPEPHRRPERARRNREGEEEMMRDGTTLAGEEHRQTVRSVDVTRNENEGAPKASVQRPVL